MGGEHRMMINFIRERRKFFVCCLFAILTLLWTMVIFAQSAKNGEQSSDDSNKVVEFIENIAEKIDPDIRVSSFAVRKLAHFSEYLMLGFFAAMFMGIADGRWLYIGAWIYAVSVAFCDEFAIQRFSEGRAPQFTDVLIDSAGALAGVLFALGLFCVIHWTKTRKMNTRNEI